MYFKDFLFDIIKVLGIMVFVIIICSLIYYDYYLGISYCNYLNIPKDFALTVMSPGIAIEICVILFIFELAILMFSINKLKQLFQKND